MKIYLLQVDFGSMTILILWILGFILGCLLYFKLNRWVFAIDETLAINREQVVVLKKIAEKLGVPASELITRTDDLNVGKGIVGKKYDQYGFPLIEIEIKNESK